MAQVFAVMHLYIYRDVVFVFFNCFFVLLLLSVPFLIRFLKSGMDELTEWSIIPACPSIICFFLIGAILKGQIFQKICVRCMCMYVLFFI